MRVVSLVPSITETLLAWGIEPVACTRFCEQPELPHVGGTKNPEIDAIVKLAPDLVLMNDEENRVEDHDALAGVGLEVHVVRVNRVEDVATAMAELARRVSVNYEPSPLPAARPITTRAFIPIWRRPYMTVGSDTYGSSLLEYVGIGNIYVDTTRYPEITLDDVKERSPDVILAPTEPYPFSERHRDELQSVAPVRFVDGKDLFWWGARTPGAIERLLA